MSISPLWDNSHKPSQEHPNPWGAKTLGTNVTNLNAVGMFILSCEDGVGFTIPKRFVIFTWFWFNICWYAACEWSAIASEPRKNFQNEYHLMQARSGQVWSHQTIHLKSNKTGNWSPFFPLEYYGSIEEPHQLSANHSSIWNIYFFRSGTFIHRMYSKNLIDWFDRLFLLTTAVIAIVCMIVFDNVKDFTTIQHIYIEVH